MNTILRLIPAPLIRAAGRVQFEFPFLAKLINFVGHLLASEGVIQRGAGKGLRLNARGCNPGYLAGTSEPGEQELLLKCCRQGSVVYDLGANCGFYAVIAARAVGPAGKVYAFEPTPLFAERIRTNAALNSFGNLETIEAAVSGRDGVISFTVSESHTTNSIHEARDPLRQSTILVRSVRLDTFAADHRPPSLLLLDIEGAEIEGLESGLETISRHRPIIMVEVHWLGNAFIDFFEEKLRPLGYSGSTYDGKPLPVDRIRYHALLLPQQLDIRVSPTV
jgi:FkbM family methyltransferase